MPCCSAILRIHLSDLMLIPKSSLSVLIACLKEKKAEFKLRF
jgi:hypothetical protein